MKWSLLVCSALLALAPAARAADRPNVLFIFSDDQRADTIAALGNQHIKTPHLDRLVKQGTAFTRAYCMGGRQGAICVPSRAMVLTGKSLFRVNEKLQGQVTWPELLARAGYVTFVTGKWHNGAPALARGFQRGRSVFLGGMGNPYALPVGNFDEKHKLVGPRNAPKHSVEQFTDEAVGFIRSHPKEKPFLAYVPLNLPHDPRVAPKKHHAYYNTNKPPLPPNYLPVHPFDNGEMVVRDERLAPWPRTPEVVRQHLADYYASITFLDEQVGRILQALEESGQLENTIIVFASDHGLAIGSHGLFGKQNLYDHSMRAPLIFAGPGIPQSKTSDALVYLHDIGPTVCDLVGVKVPAEMEGKSLVPLLKGETKQVRDAILLAYRDVQRAALDGRWHLIRYPQINRTQLFDLQNDPHETKDLSNDPRHAERVRQMMELLREQQRAYGDTLALTSERPRDATFVPPAKTGKKK